MNLALLPGVVLDGRSVAALQALKSGQPVNSSDRQGWTALLHAVAAGSLSLARDLVARHADVNARNSKGDTALLVPLRSGHLAETEMLIAAGSDLQSANEQGRTALITAAMHGDFSVCRLLLARGADPSRRDENAKTALDYAKSEVILKWSHYSRRRPPSGKLDPP